MNSPAVTPEYAAHYSGVDHKDRDTADWTVSVRGSRFYMRIFFWLKDSVIHAMYCIVKFTGMQKGHPWHKYNQQRQNGRFNFQMDLAHKLIEYGIKMDCPDLNDLNFPERRPCYMGNLDWVPCACGRCFFCKHGFTHGVSHKLKVGRKVHSTTVSAVGHTDVPIKMTEKGTSQYCRVCYHKLKLEYPDISAAARKKKCRHPTNGCPGCGPSFHICRDCWKDFDHDYKKYTS